MSIAPLASLFHGDITIDKGCDTSSYGFGDLTVNRNTYIGVGQTTDSQNPTSGSLVVYGGAGILGNSNIGGILTVNSTSNLQSTYIDTSLGGFSVSGENAVSISVGADVSLTSTNGTSSLISTNNSTIIKAGINAYDAVKIIATDPVGGIDILSGATGKIALTAGSGGIQGLTSHGNINLIANNGSGAFIVNSSASNQNLTLAQYGGTNSGVLITGSGDNTTIPAIQITTTNTGGNININNNGGAGLGTITTLTGSGGYIVTTNTGGSIQMTAQAAASYFVVNSTSSNQNLTIGLNGATNSSLILQSAGTNVSQAILIQTTNTAGSILINQPTSSIGGVDIMTGSDGFDVTTQLGGGINLLANGASSSFINKTTANGQDLTVCVQGTTGSKLILCSQGTGNQAISIQATGNSGGIYATATGPISINTSDNVNGIQIGTVQSVPVNIGYSNSTTTILGNLDIRGSTTTYESTVVTIADNILELNSAPSGVADAGVAVKRYQQANDTCLGSVVADTPEIQDTAQGGAIGQITLSTADVESDNYYNGYWIKIISGTGACQVRRIKTYNSLTKVATIYTTADQTGILKNPTPVEGLDWTTIPNNTSVYGLYPCEWIVSMWDESLKEYALVCSSFVSGDSNIPIAHYVNLHINNLTANAISVNTINGTVADTQAMFSLTDNSTTPITISNFPLNYGIYTVLIRPTTSTSRCYGIFVMGRLNSSVCGQVARLISVRGSLNEQLDFSWPANSYPQVFYRPAPGVTGTTSYTIKITSV